MWHYTRGDTHSQSHWFLSAFQLAALAWRRVVVGAPGLQLSAGLLVCLVLVLHRNTRFVRQRESKMGEPHEDADFTYTFLQPCFPHVEVSNSKKCNWVLNQRCFAKLLCRKIFHGNISCSCLLIETKQSCKPGRKCLKSQTKSKKSFTSSTNNTDNVCVHYTSKSGSLNACVHLEFDMNK